MFVTSLFIITLFLYRESINAGMSDHMNPYGSHGGMMPSDCYGSSNMDALLLSSKLSQFHNPAESLLLNQGFRNYPINSSSIPAHVLQKWSLTGAWPGPPLDQRHLAEATADLSRQYLWSKHLSAASGQFHPYFSLPSGRENNDSPRSRKEA